MKKDRLIDIVVVIIVLLGIFFYVMLKPSHVKAPSGVELSTLSGGNSVEHSKYYDIAVNYASSTPLLTKVNATADAAAVTLMKRFVNDTVAQFKTDGNFANLTPEDIKMMEFDQGHKEKLQIVYLVASSPRTVSYIYTIYVDTLGAHGNTNFKTFTFDTTTGASLSLSDLFTPGSDYLSKLSQISREKLPRVIGESADIKFINDGTTPENKNFAAFFIDNQNLDILFAPYAVAPYSAGPQTLQIPLADLGSILKPEYR